VASCIPFFSLRSNISKLIINVPKGMKNEIITNNRIICKFSNIKTLKSSILPSTIATKKALVAAIRTCSIKSSSGTTFAYAKKKKKPKK
jgi:hypothetical protein